MALLTETLTREQRIAATLLKAPRANFNMLFSNWKSQFELIWRDENPQAVLDALGTSAAELFALSAQLVTFLETLQPGCTTATLALMQPCTYNEDGTVTITVEE